MTRDEVPRIDPDTVRLDGSDGAWSSDLDDSDRQMLALFAKAAPHGEIARTLGCDTAAVGRRIQRLQAGLGVETVMQVVVQAVREDLI